LEQVEHEALHLEVNRRQGVRKGRYNLQTYVHIDLLSPARSHLLKFPKLPKIVPPAGKQAFNTWVLRDHLPFKP
jgi:hypothetical protein